ncbi:MAG: radical SAM protein, partial [Myxococcota bacterium]
MRYEGKLYRPPSEADSYILQATIGCSWNACIYCDMYRDKRFRIRDLAATLDDVTLAGQALAGRVDKVFVADGDALAMPLDTWTPLLRALPRALGPLRRVSCYATAGNVLDKTDAELARLCELGLSRLYIGPESGDDVTLKRIAKGASFDDHVAAARRA